MVVQEPTDVDAFDDILSKNKGKLIVVDFYATWCGPCKQMAPKFARLSEEHTDVLFLKIDVDECEDIVSKYDIKVMPTFVFVRDGAQIDIVEGSVEDQLKTKILKHK
ncbi:unnamed protein product [Auanema sp. JU1783]|nr:unnamed protein product [Auanema sp. JU1783]